MSPEKYNRVKEIFLAACEKAAGDRAEFVARQAAGDVEIKREVESLLAEHGRDVQVMPSDPESPLGSMSSILSRAQAEVLDASHAVEIGEEAAAGGKDEPTRHLSGDDSTPSNPSSGFIDAGRFMAGTMVANRYRIIELLGRGGMGEVYRADDVTLNQSIAMKFLPPLFGADTKWLERFHNEVRLARQVTHPNVCRVFDIGEFQGDQFISMEYVDGENLASLLRRIGRVPHDKGVQIARQLCAGLAAAHDRGVLHRDLKPANVMIDGRGSVRITDFGLAAPADQAREGLRAGTPAYMSPEQLSGRAVTVRSDIYSLGLVLYEMFTGKRAFKGESLRDYKRLHTSEEPTAPSELVEDLDPIVERVILRCLEKDPKMRPASALAVAAALPGGNPLREIVNAGETPSPEVVAAAGEAHEGLQTKAAVAYLIAGVLCLIGVVWLAPRAFVVQRAIRDTPPAALAFQAHKILDKLGYTERPRDSAQGFTVDQSYYLHVKQDEPTDMDRWKLLSRPRPGLVSYWYRQSPELLVPWHADSPVGANDPPAVISGMVRVDLDPQGHLIGFLANPVQAPGVVKSGAATSSAVQSDSIDMFSDSDSTDEGEVDWAGLLFQPEVVDMDAARLTEVKPEGTPPVFADTRMAWAGTIPGATDEPVHIEAASYKGRVVWFSMTGNWKKYSEDAAEIATHGSLNVIFSTVMITALLIAGCVLAFQNYRSGRGDRMGATRIALGFFLLGLVAWIFRAHHVPDFVLEFRLFTHAMGVTMYSVGMIWIFYLALEPYVRRIWPETVISWNRMLSGRWIDPLVGRDVLVGAVAGILTVLVTTCGVLAPKWFGLATPMPDISSATQMLLSTTNYSTLFTGAIGALLVGLILLLFLVLIRKFLRSRVLIAVLFIAALTAAKATTPISAIEQVVIGMLFLGVLMRYGLVAIIFCLFARNLLLDFPITFDFSAWYAPSTVTALAAVVLILAVSTYAAVGGRPIFMVRAPAT